MLSPSAEYRSKLKTWIDVCVRREQVGLLPGESLSDLTMDDLEAACQLANEILLPSRPDCWDPRFFAPTGYRSVRSTPPR